MIQVKNLSKSYGNIKVLDNISITFESGKIYGLVGRNGSGKTMLLKSILGFVIPDEGYVEIDGKRIGRDIEVPDHIGAIIENPGFLMECSAFENLKYLAMIRRKIDDGQIRDIIRKVGLNPDDKKKVKGFSLGMKQRLGLAQALMEEPDILLLDEPMNGLDDMGVEDIREILLDYRNENHIIIMASHSKEDIALLCDEVYRMSLGKLQIQN